jgi:hypothetical protein
MSLELTEEQKEKLRRLEDEMARKKEHDAKSKTRREASSKVTGIPVDIIDMDVIRIGTLLGLIKKKSILEGKEPDTSVSLLSMFLGGGGEKNLEIDHSKIPRFFRNAPSIATEQDKIAYHQQFVQQQCQNLSEIVMSLIQREMKNISKFLSLNIELETIENFKTICLETINVILEELCSGENDEELWSSLSVLRNALLGVLDVCEYKKLLNEHVSMLKKACKSHSLIINHLSINDLRLSLIGGCLLTTQGPATPEDIRRMSTELLIRSYMKAPELKPFNFDEIIHHCCIPSLVSLSIKDVIKYGLVGPYRNNSVGYLNLNTPGIPWSFYNLKSINPDGSRLWILDNELWVLTDHMILKITSYLIKTFRTFYFEYFKTNDFKHGFWLASQNKHYDAFLNMLQNISFVSDHEAFHKFLMLTLIQMSPLIPTEYDFFNRVSHDEIQRCHTTHSENFERNLKQLFDNECNFERLKKTFLPNS